MTESNEYKYKSFLKLYQSNEKHIFRFILSLLPNYSAAEDVMQDTMLVMWKKFDQYKPDTNFAAWGMQIGRYAVMQFQRKVRSGIVRFDSKALENIIKNKNILADKEDSYSEALEDCIKQLKKTSKRIISLRYVDNMKIIDIASLIGKTLNSTYQSVSRIHHSLLHCVEQKLEQEEAF